MAELFSNIQISYALCAVPQSDELLGPEFLVWSVSIHMGGETWINQVFPSCCKWWLLFAVSKFKTILLLLLLFQGS